jgi:hypothetical protein
VVELDRAVARRIGIAQRHVAVPLEEGYYAPDELEVIQAARADPERSRLVRENLRELDSELATAVGASDRDNWVATLVAIRLIQARAVVTRRVLEGMLGSNAADALPPLVRAIWAVGRVISAREVDNLALDELRARMHAVLEALDSELQSFLDPPE